MSSSAALPALIVLWAAPAARQATSDTAGVPFTLEAGLVFLEVGRASGPPLLALLDTGASASAIDPAHASELAVLERAEVVGTTGTLTAEMVLVEGLRVGELALAPLRSTRRDLGGLLAPEGTRVELILGSDALAGLAVTIDFEARKLDLARTAAEADSGVPMALDNGIPTLAATLGGIETRLRIDTGASLFDSDDVWVNIPAPLWQALRERHPALTPSTAFRGTGADGQAVDLPVAAVEGARIGPLELARVFVIVQPAAGYFADPGAKGFVGNNFLRRLGRVTLDYRAGRLRRAPE